MNFHLPPFAAETIFTIAGFPVTNALINSVITTLFFVVIALLVNSRLNRGYAKTTSLPDRFMNFMESVIEMILPLFDQVTRSRKLTLKFLPLVGSLFFFILISNWSGLLPGIGTIGYYHEHDGAMTLVPFFRPSNTDFNLTFAMAIVSVVASHVVGFAVVGFWKYFNKFIKIGDLWHAIISLNPAKIMTAVIEFFVGLLEIVSEIAKLASLSLRLFGNVFAGEVLLSVIGAIFAAFLPLPFMFLEIIVGVVQATVFSMLVLVYLTIAVSEPHEASH